MASDRREKPTLISFLQAHKFSLLVMAGSIFVIAAIVAVVVHIRNSYEEKAIVLLEDIESLYAEILADFDGNEPLGGQSSPPTEETTTEETKAPSGNKENEKTHTGATIGNLRTRLTTILEEYPRSFAAQKAHMRLGILALKEKNREDARLHFNSALSGNKKSFLTPIAHLYLAVLSEDLGDIQSARRFYQTIVDIYPKSVAFPRAQFALGRLAEGELTAFSSKAAIGFYKTLIENEYWSESDWASLAQSRLIFLGYYDDNASDEE